MEINKKFNDLSKKAFDEFADALEEGILDSIVGFDVTKSLEESLGILADSLGVSVEDVGPELGKMFAKDLVGKFKGSKLGQNLANAAAPHVSKFSQGAASAFTNTAEYIRAHSGESAEAFRSRTFANMLNRKGRPSATDTKSGTSNGVNIGQGAARAFGA